jgi:ribulose-phosphate 3-epimerase
MPNLFTAPPQGSLPLVAPSILAADFADMARDAGQVLRAVSDGGAGADLLHVDVMDGHFVPNLTLGADMVRCLRKHLPNVFLDVHVMVSDPGQYLEAFAKAGANHYTFHIEPVLDARAGTGMSPLSQQYDPRKLAGQVRSLGLTAGLCLNPPTPVEAVLPYIADFDLILVMSVNPGKGGQKFMPEVLSKVRSIRPKLRPDQRLEMDGGISPATAAACREAGCDTFVAGSAVFEKPHAERAAVVRAIKGV